MERMAESIMKVAMTLPEGVPLAAKGLLHLGSRAAVDQTLSRLATRGELIRAGSKLTETAKTELMSAAPQFPTWLARLVGEMVHG